MNKEKISLYNILDAKEKLNEIEKLDEQSLKEFSEALDVQEKNKVNAIISYTRELELTAESAKAEADRLLNIAKTYKNRSEKLKQYIAFAMQSHDVVKIETDRVILSLRKSQIVEIEDIEKLNDEYIIIKKQADKKKIKEAFKNGSNVLGATIITKQNLQIK